MLRAIMLDSREPKWVHQLRFGGVPTAVTTLDAGDLWATSGDGDLILVERKTPNDLLASIRDNRLFSQIVAMRQRSPWVYVVITGPLIPGLDGKVVTDHPTKWNWDSVQGALLTAQELGAMVVQAASDRDYEETVVRLALRKRDKEKVVEPLSGARLMTPAEAVLTSLPGIGVERAQRVLKHFDGSLARSLCWLTWTDTYFEVDGIGEGIKRGIRRVFKLDDQEELTIHSPESIEHFKLFINNFVNQEATNGTSH